MNRTQLYERQRLIALAKLNRFSDLMLEKKQNEEEEEGWIDKTQGYVDYASAAAGFLPPPFNFVAAGVDTLSAGVDLAQGQPKEAAFRGGMAVVGLLPVVGGAIKLGKAGTVATKAVSKATGVTKALETVGAPAVVNATKTLGKGATKSTVKGAGNLGIRQVTNAVAPYVKAATVYAKAIPPKIAQRILPANVVKGTIQADKAITKGVYGAMDTAGSYIAKGGIAADNLASKVLGRNEWVRLATTAFGMSAAGLGYAYLKKREEEKSKLPETKTPPKATAATTTPAATKKKTSTEDPLQDSTNEFVNNLVDHYINDLLKKKMKEKMNESLASEIIEYGVKRFFKTAAETALEAEVKGAAKGAAKGAVDAAIEAEAKAAGRPRHGFPVSPRRGTPSIEQILSPEFEAAGRGVGNAPFPPETTTPFVSPPIGKRIPQVGDPPQITPRPRPDILPGTIPPRTPTTPNPDQAPHPRWEPKPQPVPQPVPQPQPQPQPVPQPVPQPKPQPQPSKPAVDVRPIGELSPPKSDGVFEPTPIKPKIKPEPPKPEPELKPKPRKPDRKPRIKTKLKPKPKPEPDGFVKGFKDFATVNRFGLGEWEVGMGGGRRAVYSTFSKNTGLSHYQTEAIKPTWDDEDPTDTRTPEQKEMDELASDDAARWEEERGVTVSMVKPNIDGFEMSKLDMKKPYESIHTRERVHNIQTKNYFRPQGVGSAPGGRTVYESTEEDNTQHNPLYGTVRSHVERYLRSRIGQPLNLHLKNISRNLT